MKSHPSISELRNFGLTVGGVTIGLFGLIVPWLRHAPIPRWPWLPGLLLIVAALVSPRVLYYPFRLWDRIGKTLGWFNSRVVLNLIFFVIFVPAAIIGRWWKWDPMKRRFEPDDASYRTPSERPAPSSMEKPY